MIKAVIFDLDGVICSTDEYHYQAWKSIADEEGIYFDREINQRLRGVSRMDSLNIILERASRKYNEEEKIALATKKNNVYRSLLSNMSPKDVTIDTVDTLKKLKENNIIIAIGSSSKNTKYILERIGLYGLFDTISDGTMIQRSKPDPEVFLLASEKLGVPPSECIVVEDAMAGIEAADRGGFIPAAIGDATKSSKARIRIDKISDLLKYIDII